MSKIQRSDILTNVTPGLPDIRVTFLVYFNSFQSPYSHGLQQSSRRNSRLTTLPVTTICTEALPAIVCIAALQPTANSQSGNHGLERTADET